MKHTYQISGMTCNGCRSDVEKRLNAIPGVKEAMVTLENEQAVILMAYHISIKTFQEALPKKYVITAMTKPEVVDSSLGSSSTIKMEKSKWKQLLPLLLILSYLTVATVMLNYQRENWDEAMLDFMGLFFIVFSFFKMLDIKGFSTSFAMYDPLAKMTSVYGWVYPFLETALGLMFLMRFEIDIALIATLILLGITTIGVTKTLLDKKSISCACLGTALKLPMTEATFIENAIMMIMAIFMLFQEF
ncbi:heavy metal transporter [Nonlabens sp. MB-3u-79]|jgi:cation transport ATPase|uniref:heavy-metal-associated domain-containing protein n=1 Tax=Nonlabens sp. MB-3u-79 TaxID=2058134 RepID=UPI000C318A88|nr:heavy metal-associated domain-containing protein [Nonlabens sp. MB-3u-79]AUC79253.1 heavy metal transporter [Nonlabens sp. MB-3u-79]|tara:strand:+ start:2899 stop:3636 length:738 start_codon:yes stop_codon:yes gene_type:complete